MTIEDAHDLRACGRRGIGGVNEAPTPTSFFFSFNFITNIRQLDLIRSILCVLGHTEDSKMYTAKNVEM